MTVYFGAEHRDCTRQMLQLVQTITVECDSLVTPLTQRSTPLTPKQIDINTVSDCSDCSDCHTKHRAPQTTPTSPAPLWHFYDQRKITTVRTEIIPHPAQYYPIKQALYCLLLALGYTVVFR